MKRIRWFGAEWRVSFKTLAGKMQANTFRKDSLDGFLVDRVRETTIAGRYIEKVLLQEKITDPFGAEHIVDRTLYRQLEFNLFKTFPNIEFWDAPKTTNGYVSRLLEFSNFDMTIVPLSVDVMKWADELQSAMGLKATTVSLQISGLEIEQGVIARIAVTGDKDVRQALKGITKNKTYELDKLQLHFFHQGNPILVQLSKTGTAKIEEMWVQDFLPSLRNSLPRMN